MLKTERSLALDICDYSNKVLCSLYDGTADVSGQATDVYVKTERNGWKELSFRLPVTCLTAEGEEPNYRLQYLIANYRIRLQVQKYNSNEIETDWFIVSEPKISHDRSNKTYEVVADHISSLLKTKNLGLEFSDEEGNNTGTIQQIAKTILEGTGWHIQDPYYRFMEDKNLATSAQQEKVRSFTASAKTGAFKMMSDLCEKFDAKPVYHGEGTYLDENGELQTGRTVEIVPMNPFSEVEGSEIPEEVMNGENVLELHYNRNITSVRRTLDSRNLVTKLYAYGAYGDTDLGLCSMENCEHTEYRFTIPQSYSSGKEFHFKDANNINHYFTATNNLTASSKLVYSDLDPLSSSYVYNESAKKAYKVYKIPNGTATTLTVTPSSVKNGFQYLMDFNYYNEVNLLTDEMLQTLAKHQREMPAVIERSTAASTSLIESETELSEIAESNTGFLRLAVSSTYTTGSSGELKLTLDKSVYPDGIMYRSDYEEAKRNYFSWYCASQLKDNGDPVKGIGSVVYIIHNTNPQTWEKAYVKYIDDKPQTQEYGKPDSVDPSTITLWINRSKVPNWNASDRFYLFCTNSISGRLGVKEGDLESIQQTIQTTTKTQTETHPVYFVWDNDPAPATNSVQTTYGWYYRSTSTNMNVGSLYFCYGSAGDTTWHPVLIAEDDPACVNGSYYFNTHKKTLYLGSGGSWVQYTDPTGKRLATHFSKVIYYCRRYDMTYKGLYDKYVYDASTTLPVGNYAIDSDFGFYWVFSTDRSIAVSSDTPVYLDPVKGYVYEKDDEDNIFSPESKSYDVIDFPAENELEGISLTQGAIDRYTGLEINSTSLYRTMKLTVHPSTRYRFVVPSYSYAVFYTANNRYINYQNLNSSGYITTPNNTKYVRFVLAEARREPYATSDSWRLNQSGGLCTSNANYRLRKYSVSPGMIVKVISDDRFQFQTVTNVPSSGTPNIVGPTYTRGTYVITVPEGASHLIVSTPKTGSQSDVFVSFNPTAHYVQVDNVNSKIFVGDKEYTILPFKGSGDRKGIMYFIKQFADVADRCYMTYRPAFTAAQDVIKANNNQLAAVLGDLYREGYWQKNDYVAGDEKKLYKDAYDALVKIAKPEATYEINFLDLYGSNHDIGMSIDETDGPEWPDIDISDAVHLVDDDIDINCWAFIDKVEKCYDKPWQTKLTINTNLSLIGQKTFADVMTHIAEVANEAYANQTLYKRAGALSGTGKLTVDKLEGAIKANTVLINGGSSNWYTDEKGAIILEAADGQSAMKLTGAGFGVASSKDQWGDWNWRTFGTGNGFTADEIVAGEMSAVHLMAGSITVDQINASVGQQLDIGSNNALLLYSTVDGLRPAGALRTKVAKGDGIYRDIDEGDSYIYIGAKDESNPSNPQPAEIDIMTGGLLNLQGSTMNLAAESAMNLQAGTSLNIRSDSDIEINANSKLNIVSGGDFTVDSNNFKIIKDASVTGGYKVTVKGRIESDEGNIAGFTIAKYPATGTTTRQFLQAGGTDSLSSTADGVYLGTDGINIGGKFVFSNNGSTTKLNIDAQNITFGSTNLSAELATAKSSINGTSLKIDANSGVMEMLAANSITIKAGATITINASQKLTLTTAGTIELGNANKAFTIGAAGNGTAANPYRAYIYNGKSTLGNTADAGIYIGTDGIRIGKGYDSNTTTESKFFTAKADGTVELSGKIHAGEGDIGGWTIGSNYIGSGTTRANSNVGISNQSESGWYAFWAGAGNNINNAKFAVDGAGKLIATDAQITGTISATTLSIGNVAADTYVNNRITNNDAVKKAAYLDVDTSGKITATCLSQDINNKLTKAGGISVDGSGKILLTSLAETVVTSNGLATTLGDYAKTEQIPGKISQLTWDSLGNSSKIELKPESITITTSGKFSLDSTNLKITNDGTIKAKAGEIANWTIAADALYTNGKNHLNYYTTSSVTHGNPTAGIYVGTEGISLGGLQSTGHTGHCNFEVSASGILYAKDAHISGTFMIDQNSNIAGWTLQSGFLWSESADYIGTGTASDRKIWQSCVCISPAMNNNYGYVFWAGSEWPEASPGGAYTQGYAPVRIKADGSIICKWLGYWDGTAGSKGTTHWIDLEKLSRYANYGLHNSSGGEWTTTDS